MFLLQLVQHSSHQSNHQPMLQSPCSSVIKEAWLVGLLPLCIVVAVNFFYFMTGSVFILSFKRVYMKMGLQGFWRAPNRIFLFGPLYSPWKKIKIDLLGGSNRQLLKLLQSLRPTGLHSRVILRKKIGEILFYNKTYALDG